MPERTVCETVGSWLILGVLGGRLFDFLSFSELAITFEHIALRNHAL